LPVETEFAQEWLWMDWPSEIGRRFANWLNSQLEHRLPVGEVEASEWRKVLLADEDGFKQQLRELRRGYGNGGDIP
jgi:CRISPR-associated protein Csy1